jgi:hypothetical protein
MAWASINAQMAHRHEGESINRRDTTTVLAGYAAWVAEQPLSTSRCKVVAEFRTLPSGS